VLGDVTDSNNGWYTASYVLQKAGAFSVAIGLADAWGSTTSAGVCHHTVTAAEQCCIMEAQTVVVAGQQAKLRIARFDRCGRREIGDPCAFATVQVKHAVARVGAVYMQVWKQGHHSRGTAQHLRGRRRPRRCGD